MSLTRRSQGTTLQVPFHQQIIPKQTRNKQTNKQQQQQNYSNIQPRRDSVDLICEISDN